MAKTDLSDAYMRVWVNILDVPKLAFAIPQIPSDPEPLIGFHLSPPMGYIESVQYFCAVSETVSDFTNNGNALTAHPLEDIAQTTPDVDDPSATGVLADNEEKELETYFNSLTDDQLRKFIDYIDLYVDEYIALRQGTKKMRR